MTDGDDNEEIVEELRSFLGTEFDDASLDEVTGALDQLADQYGEMADDSGIEGQSSVAEVEPRESETQQETERASFLDAFSSTIEPFDVDTEGERPLITVSSRSSERVDRLLEQILDVHGVWLELDTSLRLNREVELLVDLPDYGLELAVTGRVVHATSEGTALDVSSMDPEVFESFQEVRAAKRHRRETRDSAVNEAASSRVGAETSAPLEESSKDESGLDLSHTFESLNDDEGEYWYGPKTLWFETEQTEPEATRFDADLEPLLLEQSAACFSGLAHVRAGEREWQLHFDEGFIVDIAVKPRSSDHELGPLLRLADRVSEDELGRASSYGIKNNVSLERALHELEILPDDEIRRAVSGRIRYLLRDLCDTSGPEVELFEAGSVEDFELEIPEVRAHVPSENVVFRRRFDRFDQSEPTRREQLVERHRENHPRVAADAEGRIQRSFFDEAHRRMVETLVEGGRRLEDLVTESFLPPAETVSVVLALYSMDLVKFDPDPDSKRAARYAEDEAEIKHLSVHKASFFEVLNIHWSCYDTVVEAAYERVSGGFVPDEAPAGVSEAARMQIREISERVDEAYEVLSDRETRHQYRAKIMPEYKIEHALPLLMKRAELAQYSGRLEVARDSVARILELDPGHRRAQEMYRELAPGTESSVGGEGLGG